MQFFILVVKLRIPCKILQLNKINNYSRGGESRVGVGLGEGRSSRENKKYIITWICVCICLILYIFIKAMNAMHFNTQQYLALKRL